MSAIFGILQRDGEPIDEEILRRVGGTLAHHGEASPRVWTDASAGLGCCHFPATPEAVGEVVPYVHPASGVVVTADVRLDERDGLVAALGLSSSHVPPDTTLLAEAYLKWGEACPERLLGDFAFAVWDPRHGRLCAARDHFGIKPFYYTADHRRLAFATEPRALLALPGVDREIDRTTLAVSLAEIYDTSDRTVYRAVRSLRNAETLVVTRGETRVRRYYQPDPERRIVPRSDAEAAEAFRDHLFRAVRRRLRSSGPVGCMLSGGLDSSAVTCAAAQITASTPSAPRLETFSLVYPDRPECDESRYIEAVVRRVGLPWTAVPVDARRTLDDVRRLADALQTPNVPFGVFANGSVCRQAAASGMRVLLDGHGGDETVSLGYEYLRELRDDGQIFRLAYEYLRLASADSGMNGWRGLLGVLTNMGIPGRVKRRFQWLVARWHGQNPASGGGSPWPFLAEGLVQEAGLAEREAAMKAAQVDARAHKRWHDYVVTQTGQERAFPTLRRLAGTPAVDLRYPLWDKDLVEFCLTLPGRQKFRHGFTRATMRRALRSIVPAEIINRRDKTDFLPQATSCLRNLDKNACKSSLAAHNPREIPILDAGWSRVILERFLDGQPVSSFEQQALWRSLAAATWLETRGQA